jgi:uncharacterized protein
MSNRFDICDLHDHPHSEALLRLNNASARETSLLTPERFDRLIRTAHVALFIPPAVALLLAFEDTDDYDGGHFLWFRRKPGRFLYVDRVVISEEWRRRGLARRLYEDLFKRAARLGHSRIVCEVNVEPPNPVSTDFTTRSVSPRSAARPSTTAPRPCDISRREFNGEFLLTLSDRSGKHIGSREVPAFKQQGLRASLC